MKTKKEGREKKERKENKAIALSQIFIMIIGIFAVAYALGSEVRVVSAADATPPPTGGTSKVTVPSTAKLGTISSTGTVSSSTYTVTADGLTYTKVVEGQTITETISKGETITKTGNKYFWGEKEVNIDVNSLLKSKELGSTSGYFGTETTNGITSYYQYTYNPNTGIIDSTQYSNYGEFSSAKYAAEHSGETPGLLEDGGWFGKGTLSGGVGTAIVWAGVVYGIVAMVDALAPDSWQPYTDALTYALPGGTLAGGLIYNLWGKQGFFEGDGLFGVLKETMTNYAGVIGISVGVAVAAGIFLMMYEDTEQEIITFTCSPWEAPLGGSNCEKCNTLELPCSEYQCKSLGQACQLQNANTESPLCTWVSKGDVIAPVITLWTSILTTGLSYSPITTFTPQDKGTTIQNSAKENKCLDAYTPLTFGVQTDEPAKCMMDIVSKQNFSDMSYAFGSSLYLYNHSYTISIPLADSSENLTLKNGGQFQIYLRCQDANGNYNVGNFVFKLCIDESPDTTAPQILGTNLINNMPIAYNTSSVNIELYTNEPADCKWDTLDKGEYDKMDNSMTCSRSAKEINADLVYTCKGNLTGIKSGSGVENNYFFKCKDKPTATTDRITNAENYKFTILGTQLLILGDIGPNETIKDNTDPVTVTLIAETSAGYEDGESTCYYSLTGKQVDYTAFFNTESYTHSQDLELSPAKYNISIKCVDLGGNSASGIVNFTVESDGDSPEIIRFYKDGTNLRMRTNEYAECVYSIDDCNYQFIDGISMTTIDETNQYTSWVEDQPYYIKCKDKYENQPDAGTCSLTIKSYEEI